MSPFAVLLLGWCGFKALIQRPFKAPGAERRTLRRAAADRLAPLSEDGREALRAAGACLACGRCDERSDSPAPVAGPSSWVLGGLRDLTDHDLAAEAPGSEERLAEFEVVCPVGVPFRRLAAAARTTRDRMRRPVQEPRRRAR